MLRFIFTKIKNKYKLYICLVIGIVTMVAVVALIQMFRNGALNKLLQSNFVSSYEESGMYPAVLSMDSKLPYKKDSDMIENVKHEISKTNKAWNDELGIPSISNQSIIYVKGRNSELSLRGNSAMFNITSVNSDMEEHFIYTDGGPLDSDLSEFKQNGLEINEDAVPCLVTQVTADLFDLVVGETIMFDKIAERRTDISVFPKTYFVITGIISEKPDDYYWQKSLESLDNSVYISEENLESFIDKYSIDHVYYTQNAAYDYRAISASEASACISLLKDVKEKYPDISENITPVLKSYEHDSKSLKAILYVISLPLLMLVLLFIGMISFRIADSERDEISQMTRRGISRTRILFMYLIQSVILSVISLIPGVMLGYLMGKLTAGVDDFLGFSLGENAVSTTCFKFYGNMIYVGFLSLFAVIIIIMLPVFLGTGSKDITKRKKPKSYTATPLWEKYYLDVVFLLISIYLLYNYNKQLDTISEKVISGEGIDPVIFLDSTLFLMSCGLIILRLSSYVLMLIYKLTKKRLKPASLAGILQVLRTRHKSSTLSIFLVITVAMSLFNANMARTINANQEKRLTQDLGADFVINENWNMRVYGMAPDQTWDYVEPDEELYYSLADEGKAASVTKVMRDDNTSVKHGADTLRKVTLMGIDAKSFGETADMAPGCTKEHWYNYLNEMSQMTNGCIISKTLAKTANLKVGDRFTYTRYSPLGNGEMGNATVQICAIVDAWPGYVKHSYNYDEKGNLVIDDNYLIVTNYSSIISSFNITPCQIWVKSDMDYDSMKNLLDERLESTGRRLKSIESIEKNIRDMKSSALIQITNGLFTAIFLVALILCILGFMIHWISSIRDRTMLFGVYRAMGISMREVEKMLVIEQVCLSVISILAGFLSGVIATKLFSMLFAVVYLPQKHSLKLENIIATSDMMKLGIILIATVLICLIIIRSIIRKMNITQALKLGDD